MSRLAPVALLALAVALSACAASRGRGRGRTDGGSGRTDGAVAMDGGTSSDGGGGTDAGPDAGGADAGGVDAGGADAGGADAGGVDAGGVDAGPPDAGLPDAGPPDSGPPDSGPPDAGPPDAGTGTTTDYTAGGRTRMWTTSGYWRGNVYRAVTSTTLRRFASYLGLSGSCELGFYVFTSSSVSGPFTRVWSSSTTSSGTGYHSSGTIDLVTTAGVYYTLGVGWSCSATYYSAEYDTMTGIDAGIGTLQGNAWSNSYPGYSTGFTPSTGSAGGAHYDQVITISP